MEQNKDQSGAAVRGEAVALTAADYEEVLTDHRRLVRELDVILNGEVGAAKQASLGDIVRQVKREGIRFAPKKYRAADAPSEPSELAETIRQLRNIASEDVTPYFCTNVPKDLLRRAADALDSQPTESPDAEYVLDGYYRKNGKHFDKLRGLPNSCTLDSGWVAHYVRVEDSSQPTDGGVRNG